MLARAYRSVVSKNSFIQTTGIKFISVLIALHISFLSLARKRAIRRKKKKKRLARPSLFFHERDSLFLALSLCLIRPRSISPEYFELRYLHAYLRRGRAGAASCCCCCVNSATPDPKTRSGLAAPIVLRHIRAGSPLACQKNPSNSHGRASREKSVTFLSRARHAVSDESLLQESVCG